MNVIEAENLSKTYRRFRKREGLLGSIQGLWKREYEEKEAVKQMDLQVREGELLGLIGPNGAGKTTLIKMLTGIIAPSHGRLNVLGYYPNDLKNEFKRQYAVVMGQKSQLFPELTASDTLQLFRAVYEIPEKEYRETKAYFEELFGVKKLMDVQVRTLSLGERMKMELIAALLHNPKILFLDEPTIGLDAVASRQIRGFLKEINRDKGTTILLTSHYMEDIRALCGRSVVINHGTKIYDGGTQELFERYQKNKRITICFPGPIREWKTPTGAVMLEDHPERKVLEVKSENSARILRELMAYDPRDVAVEEEEIGTVVERIYQEGGNGLA